MPNRISKEDVKDVDFIDAYELASDGNGSNSIYLNTFAVSTTSGSGTVVITLASDGEGILYSIDHPVQSKDIVWIYGTTGGGGDGYYTVNSIVSDTSFTVNEAIGNSTDGYAQFRYPAGALSVGFSRALYTPVHITHNNVQGALQDLDIAIANTSYITKQIEVDFGTILTNYKTFTIVDVDVTSSSKLFPTQAGNAPTGRSYDENEMDPIIFSANPGTGQFILIASSKDGPVVGKYKINYGIG
jgi:hypothetical protein